MPYVLALKPSHAWWCHEERTATAVGGGHGGRLEGKEQPGEWMRVRRAFRDGHDEKWWALEAEGWTLRSQADRRLVVVTTDPAKLPDSARGT